MHITSLPVLWLLVAQNQASACSCLTHAASQIRIVWSILNAPEANVGPELAELLHCDATDALIPALRTSGLTATTPLFPMHDATERDVWPATAVSVGLAHV